MIYIGIDIGQEGAVTFHSGEAFEVYKTKLHRKTIFDKLLSLPTHTQVVVALEDLRAVFGSSASSTFSFGKSAGFWEGIIALLEHRRQVLGSNVHFVRPTDWQEKVTNKPPRPKTRGLPKKVRDKMNREHKAALKKESCDALFRATGTRLTDDNECDACNLARYIRALYEENRWHR